MLQPLIDAIRQSRSTVKLEMGGLEYLANHEGVQLPPDEPRPDSLELTTLQGLIDSLPIFADRDLIIHVANYWRVCLYDQNLIGRHRQRPLYAASVCDRWDWGLRTFDQDEFLVTLLTRFSPTEYRDYLIRIASNLATERVITQDDDGLTQRVSVRQGLRRIAEETLQPIGGLKPYRSFPEIDPPASQFLLRIDTDKGFRLTLHESKDQRWKLEAVSAIAQWLRERTDILVIA